MRNIAIPFLLSCVVILASFNIANVKDYRVRKIVIDAGHGGKDVGASGVRSHEKDIALIIAKKVGGHLEGNLPDTKVIYTRSDNNFIELDRRADIANKAGADLFVSIHCNAISNPTIRGTETFVMGLHVSGENLNVAQRENSVILLEDNYEERYNGFDPKSPESYILFSLTQHAYHENSIKLAQKIENQFKDRANRRSRGVKSAGFMVLWQTTMPSVLVETGFLSNPQEEKELNDDLYQEYIASAIFRAIRDYKKELESY